MCVVCICYGENVFVDVICSEHLHVAAFGCALPTTNKHC